MCRLGAFENPQIRGGTATEVFGSHSKAKAKVGLQAPSVMMVPRGCSLVRQKYTRVSNTAGVTPS